ncbi:MAG: hypothetical protein BWK76_24095 [Desulfobulbaceae bacterium A2]|nr:MAG: hypothetical protein BWK76_24095 [Desulfobulbaceae bacterium A2]
MRRGGGDWIVTNCLVLGDARIAVQLRIGEAMLAQLWDLSLIKGRIDTRLGYQVRFLQLEPMPLRAAAAKEIAPESYAGVFVVSRPVP